MSFRMLCRSRRARSFTVAALCAFAALAAAPACAGQAHLAGLDSDGRYQRLLVKFRAGSAPARESAALDAALRAAAGRASVQAGTPALKRLRRLAIGADVIALGAPLDGRRMSALIRAIAARAEVEWVQPDLPVQTTAVPNDTHFDRQWDLADSAVGIRAPVAWDTANGAGAVVAVIDTGILSHPDLNANVLPGYDMLSEARAADDGDGRDANPVDSSMIVHGTHVAGTAAAVAGNALGVAGVAPGAKILPVRVVGRGANTFYSDLADAIVWASGGRVSGVPANPNPAEAINLSVGQAVACSRAPAWQAAIDAATANGTIVVAAGGNNNVDVAGFAPASCNNTITVAATDRGGRRAWYSNYGTGVDIAAPGGERCSPSSEFLPLGRVANKPGDCTRQHVEQGIVSTVNGNGYGYDDGTSMASPHVAGVVALIQSSAATPKTFQQVRQILADTARPIAPANCPGGCGPGLIDAAAAVKAAAQ